MSIDLKNTSGLASNGVKILAYGESGAGKTTAVATLPSPLVLSAEAGLLSLAGKEIPYIEIDSMAMLHDAYRFIASDADAMKSIESIAIDSISEIAEIVLSAEMKNTKDPRQAYGAMIDQMGDVVRAFRDLPGRHVYMTAKCEKQQDDLGKLLYSPSMPGKKAAQALPYFFDEVLAIHIHKDAEGTTHRMFMTGSDGLWLAKDRSGKLDIWEPVDLGALIEKIKGGVS